MMKRVAMMSLLCSGAAAQQVKVDGLAAGAGPWPVSQAMGKPFGKDGDVVVVPEWIKQLDGDYWHVGAYDGTLSFIPDGVAPSRGASALGGKGRNPNAACGMGWAKGPESTCFTKMTGMKPNNWGWTNEIDAGETQTGIPVYIGASQCEGGHHRADIAVYYDTETTPPQIRVDLGSGLRAAHVYVGKKMLPTKGDGVTYTNAPGSFPVKVNVNDDPVVTFDADGTSPYYFAVHVNTCGVDDTPTPPTPTPTPPPEPCPSTFLVQHYVCAQPACDATAANGNLGAALVAAGWTNTGETGMCFTTPGSDYRQYTNVLVKEITEAEDAPPAAGTVNYIGVVALGCGASLVLPEPGNGGGGGHGNGGPAQFTCADFCLGALAGFQ